VTSSNPTDTSSTTGASELGELLKQRRIANGITQEELAERAGVSVRAISDLERGLRRAPHKETLNLLADALRMADDERAALHAAAYRIRGGGISAPLAPSTQTTPSAMEPVDGAFLYAPFTPLIGREQDQEAIVKLLLRPITRLVTLIGPAGIGKTRLALSVARELTGLPIQFSDGVTTVALATVHDPATALGMIAQVTNLPEAVGVNPLQRLIDAFHEKNALLLLDNLEQVTSVGPALVELLRACPLLKLLITSRSALRVSGEYEYAVPPLSLPENIIGAPLESLAASAAVTLFTQRAQTVQPGFTLTETLAPIVGEICQRLDGIPLAIELAAARLRLFSAPMLLARMEQRFAVLTGGSRDLPERQRTMERAIGWSYDLLSDAERMLFQRLAVFEGSFTLHAAEAICADDLRLAAGMGGATNLFDLMDGLVNNSLLQRWEPPTPAVLPAKTPESRPAPNPGEIEPRFHLLETIRQFGLERLVVSGASERIHARHAEYFLALAEEAEPKLRGAGQDAALRQLSSDNDNLRAALRWARTHHAAALGLRLAGALWRYWIVAGALTEGRAWLNEFLQLDEQAAPADKAPIVARAQALYGEGTLAAEQGAYEQANARAYETLALFPDGAVSAGVWGVRALNLLAVVARYRSDMLEAERLYLECLTVQRALDDKQGIAVALNNLGVVAVETGAHERATGYFEESLELKRQIGDTRGVAVGLLNLGDLARKAGDHARALALFEESHALFTTIGDRRGAALSLSNQGEAWRTASDLARAEARSRQALAIFREINDLWGMTQALNNLGAVALSQGDDTHAQAHYSESLMLYQRASNQVGVVEAIEGIAALSMRRGDAQRAVRLWGATTASRATSHTPLAPDVHAAQEEMLAQARRLLGEETFKAAWAEGRQLSHAALLAEAAGG